MSTKKDRNLLALLAAGCIASSPVQAVEAQLEAGAQMQVI